MKDKIFCTYCGEELDLDTNFCSECGKEIVKKETDERLEKTIDALKAKYGINKINKGV